MTRFSTIGRIPLFALACVLPAAAHAQTDVAAQEGSDAETASAESGDIIVQARRRAERLQDVPVAITAVTGEDLANRGVLKFDDLAQQTPGLQSRPPVLGFGSSITSIRGLGISQFRVTNDQPVAQYIDGVYFPHGYGTVLGDFWDVERVEVLKGPQGTLYGRSTDGGAVNQFYTLPKHETEAVLRARYGNYNQYQIAGVINLPMSADLAIRVAASAQGHTGTGRNLTLGTDLGVVHSKSIRGTILWEPSDALKVMLRGDYARARTNSNVQTGSESITAGTPVPGGGTWGDTAARVVAIELGLNPDLPASLVAAQNALNATANLPRNQSRMNVQPYDNPKAYGTSLTIEAGLSDEISLKSISAYRGFKRQGATDLDGTPYRLFAYTSLFTKYDQFSQEIQVDGNVLNDRLNFVLGAIYSHEKARDIFVQENFNAITPTNPTTQDGTATNKSWGFFGQATLKVASGFDVTGGVRYSIDTRRLLSRNRTAAFCTALGTPLATTPDCSYKVGKTFKEWSWTIGANYDLAPDVMIYAKADRGYRSGEIGLSGGSTNPLTAPVTFTPVNPEILQNYEIGLKARLFDHKLGIDLAAFHADFSDIIITRTSNVPGIGFVGFPQNAASADIEGFEGDVTFNPVPELELHGTVAYLNAKFNDYISGASDFAGFRLQFAPKWQYSLSAAYTVPTKVGDLRLQADYSWVDWQYTQIPTGISPSHENLNARINLHLDEQNMDIAVFGTNLTNKRYTLFPFDAPSVGLYINGVINDPRMYGVEATIRF